MSITRKLTKPTLAALTALSMGGLLGLSPATPSLATASQENGSKTLRIPSAEAKSAPLISWLPPEGVKPQVAMLCIHGFSLHKGSFTAFGKVMAKDGVATYALDLRGFGESKSKAIHTELDFDGSMADIKAILQQIRKTHPGLPVIVLGESMGGAIALRAAALYPELVSGLIASVPARDRFGMSEEEREFAEKAGLQTIFGGYSRTINNAALAAVKKISQKEEVRATWTNDPLMRTNFSPKEFVQLDGFMSKNLEAAAMVKNTPVLFIQGTNDKLIRPAGTWKLFERLGTPHRQLVLSKNSEHLIFEEGQYRQDDLKFVLSWINNNVSRLDVMADTNEKLPVVASKAEYSAGGANSDDDPELVAAVKNGGSTVRSASANAAASEAERLASAAPAELPRAAQDREFKNRIQTNDRPKISYWIELYRGGKVFRCNNKMEFKTGDAIRFHLIPESDGYAYLVMKESSTGKSDVLFPNKTYGSKNFLRKGQDYPIPSEGWMAFDANPGTEQLGLVFGKEQIAVTPETLKNGQLTAWVSSSEDGSKDLCPTRLKLSWDDPMPVMLPDDFKPLSQVARATESSLVRLTSTGGGMIAANIQLLHGK
ncbi:MAG: alpha/beta fold hydrolase [Candidatus Obscuribacterales bacterium]|nr:alpha/beta fold hydrolase [Candidatus Obscuribacterales bacterium]